MASPDVVRQQHPRGAFETAVSPPSSTNRMVHSRQMSSLSMNTFTTTQSHHPAEPLLQSSEHHDAHSRGPPRPDALPQDRGYWTTVHVRRMRRWRMLSGVLLSIMVSWATFTTVRYFVAYVIYPGRGRRAAALSLGIASFLAFLFSAGLALSFVLPCRVAGHRPRLRPLRHVLPILVSFFLFAPTVVNLVLVLVWRRAGSSSLSLRGRCHWSLDVVWVGVGGQCADHAPAFGVWLTAAILRLVLTAAFLVAYHIASTIYRTLRWPPSYRSDDIRGMDSVDMSQVLSRPSPVLHPSIHKGGGVSGTLQRSFSSSRMAAIPEFSDAQRHQYSQEPAGRSSGESSSLSEEDSTHLATESGHFTTAPTKSLRRTRSTRDVRTGEGSSSRNATLPSNMGEGDLQGFADRFRDLVDRVSRELEESRIAERETESRTPPLHHVLDTHTPYMTIDEFGREVPSEEPIAMLGGVIRRMPTIESVGSREFASIRSATLLGGGAASSAASSRPPTRATVASFNDAASASFTSASAPSSRSNSLHRLRMPSELGELVRDALRVRGGGQSRALSSARPGSAGSMSGSGCTGESASALPRSRSNSLGANELLAPVTEHGELGRDPEDVPLRIVPTPVVLARRQRSDTPEQQLMGVVGAGEMGDLVRAERSTSWAGSSHSATSTAYFSAGTSGSAGGGGDNGTGTGSYGGPR